MLLRGHRLNGETDGRDRHVHDQINAIVVPAARDRRADIRLELVIAGDDGDRTAEDGAAGILHGQLGGGDRSRTAHVHRRAGHVRQHANADGLLGAHGMHQGEQQGDEAEAAHG